MIKSRLPRRLALLGALLCGCGLFEESDGAPLAYEYRVIRPGLPPTTSAGLNGSYLVYNAGDGNFGLAIRLGDSLSFFQILPASHVPAPGTYPADQSILGNSPTVLVTCYHDSLENHSIQRTLSFVQIDSVGHRRLFGAFHLEFDLARATPGFLEGRFATPPNHCQTQLTADSQLTTCNPDASRQ
jgi:hypothetical protein